MRRFCCEGCYLLGAIYISNFAISEVLTAVLLKIRVSRNIKFCRTVNGYRSFKEFFTLIRMPDIEDGCTMIFRNVGNSSPLTRRNMAEY